MGGQRKKRQTPEREREGEVKERKISGCSQHSERRGKIKTDISQERGREVKAAIIVSILKN